MDEFSQNTSCCFTGHRPEKIDISPFEAKEKLRVAIKQAIADGFTSFISGMARGTDMWAAELVIEEKKYNKDIHLICALPHPNFEKKWSADNQNLFNYILSQADEIHTISNFFSMGAYMIRNKWMVDRSSLVIAFFNGSKGGTKNTIDYANKNGIETIIL